MTETTTPQLYKGAATCDFRPDWDCAEGDHDLRAMLEACHAADPDELTPTLVLADLFAERGDPREHWLRLGCDLWAVARTLKPGRDGWDYDGACAALTPVCKTVAGWRLACMWGHMVAWHAPSGYGPPMGRTWADARVAVVSRCVWWWSMGLLTSQASAAWSQASAAWSQASAAGDQAYAALSHAYAARRQAYAARNQAYAARRQAYAARNQAGAAWNQASAALSHAYAARSQADAAGVETAVWAFARGLWDVCVTRLPEVEDVHG